MFKQLCLIRKYMSAKTLQTYLSYFKKCGKKFLMNITNKMWVQQSMLHFVVLVYLHFDKKSVFDEANKT
ncbi:hypothetical protein BpHYR1_026204 [Brachionus plicatilis]|uniref:Uncharacterized protein n=1 Tax=Brachionus plicatilis TaxID=10195 RepID=A0A3M7QZC7_BRAPC|nr:hypothetical protein BpHYR1_026204 [Brachionus plicatilis]